MHKIHLTVIFLLLLMATTATAQEKVTVKDPEIAFSYEKPKNWYVQDDGYNYMVSLQK